MTTTTRLEEEVRFFYRSRQELLSEDEGRFALIKGTQVVAMFDDEDSAIVEGVRRFGFEPFLVKQVLAQEPVRYFPFDLGPGLHVDV